MGILYYSYSQTDSLQRRQKTTDAEIRKNISAVYLLHRSERLHSPAGYHRSERLHSPAGYRVDEHKNTTSSIGKHFRDKHCIVPKDLDKQFHVIEKCKTKFDCLVHEMLVIRDLSPSLNVQSDSIRAKLFA